MPYETDENDIVNGGIARAPHRTTMQIVQRQESGSENIPRHRNNSVCERAESERRARARAAPACSRYSKSQIKPRGCEIKCRVALGRDASAARPKRTSAARNELPCFNYRGRADEPHFITRILSKPARSRPDGRPPRAPIPPATARPAASQFYYVASLLCGKFDRSRRTALMRPAAAAARPRAHRLHVPF